MEIYFNPSADPAFNLALEEVMARTLRGSALMLWQNRSAVIVGRNQSTLAEVNTAYLNEHHIGLVRRMTGGGAVYHDSGNLNYSCMLDSENGVFASFAPFAEPVMAALRSLGLNPEFTGRNDILLEGRKISGTAKCVFPHDRVLFHGTLLFDTDVEVLSKVLTPDPDKITFNGIRSVRARVGNLHEYLPGIRKEDFPSLFLSLLLRQAGKEQADPIPDDLQAEAERLADEKYRTWDWNYGSSPAYDYHKKARFAGGSVCLELRIRFGRIEDIRITGDFFGEQSVSELANLLKGIPFRRNEAAEVLQGLDFSRYMTGIAPDDFLSLFE